MKTRRIISHITFLLLSALMTLPTGCGVPDNSRLLAIEAAMEEHSDSASRLLDSISPASLSGSAESALYHLLTTQANYKNHIPIPSDSAISLAVERFGRFPADNNRLMKSLYYRATINYRLTHTDAAFNDVSQAFKIANKLNDPLWIARSADFIADIYYDNYRRDEAIEYIDIATVNYHKANKTLNKYYSLLQKAAILTDKHQYDESLELIDSIIAQNAEWDNDSLLMSHCLDASLSPLVYSARYNIALDQLSIRAGYPFPMSCHTLAMCAIAFHEIGEHKIATEYLEAAFESALSETEKLEILTLKRDFLYELDTPNTIPHFADTINAYYNNAATQVLNKSQELSNSIFKNQINHLNDLSTHRKFIIILLVSILILTFSLYIYTYLNHRRKSYEIKEIKTLSSELFGTHYQTVNKLCDEYLLESDSDSDRLKIYRRIKAEIISIGNSQNLREIILWVDKNKEGKLSMFFDQVPELTLDEKKIITFVIAGFSPKTISLFMDLKYKTFYTRLNRLKSRLKEVDNPLTEWILQSITLRR